jgi:hypothetical protein
MMLTPLPADYDLDSVFNSSALEIRNIKISNMNDWLRQGYVAGGIYTFDQDNGMLGLFFRTNKWIDNFLKQNTGNASLALSKALYHIEQTQAKLLRSVGRGANGGDEHRELSRLGAMFLKKQGKQWKFEERFNRKRVDIISTDHEWVIECGDTQARPVVEHLYGGDDHTERCNMVGIIPFQDASVDFHMYVFKRGSAWDEKWAKSIFWREDISVR